MGDVAATESDAAPARVFGCIDSKVFGWEIWVFRQVGLSEAAAGFWTAEGV